MSLDEDIGLLKQVDLFNGFDDTQLRLLAFGAQYMHFAEGEELFHNGSIAIGGYLLCAGRVELLPEKIGNADLASEFFGSKEIVGSINLISGKRNFGTAIARSQVEALIIPREAFMRIMNEYPHLAEMVLERLSQPVLDTVNKLDRLRGKLG